MADLDFTDQIDFGDVERGFVGTLDDPVITAADGHVVWDCSKYDFITGDAPNTANPSLWRQGKLVAKHGLFELTDGVYQVRGLDLSNMSLVETDTGVIVIDTLMSDETAAAALALYRKHRGDRPVKALLITHSHADHYGGSAGVADADTPVYALSGFLAHAVSENVYAGAAMSRRAAYIYAADLPGWTGGPDWRRAGHGHLERHDLAAGPDRRRHPHRPGGRQRRRPGDLPGHPGHRGPGADPNNAEARELLATALEQLGHGAENGLWRNIYLRGAEELRGPIAPPPPELASPQVLGALTIEQLFDSLGVRIDGLRAAEATVCIDWVFTDLNRTYRTELSNGALIHADAGYGSGQPGLTITLAKPQLIGVIATGKLDVVQHEGDASLIPTLLGLLDSVDHQFPIVTP